jgi:hypothetical protein
MIEQGIFSLVTQNSGVKSAVGVDVNGTTKAYWVQAPQGASLPMLIFSRVGTTDPYTMAGPLGMREGLFQIVAYSTSYLGSRTVAEAVRKFLSSYTGTLPDTDATVVKAVMIVKDFDSKYEEGSKGFIFGAYLQFRVWFLD